jgi:hypothetical protein
MLGKYNVDILLLCGCVIVEKVESIIYLPNTGEQRHCPNHDKDTLITKIGNMYKEFATIKADQ